MSATVRVDLPTRFYQDHVERDLPSGTVVKVLARTTRVDLDQEAYDDLVGDAVYYTHRTTVADLDPGYMGLVASARATRRILSATPRPGLA